AVACRRRQAPHVTLRGIPVAARGSFAIGAGMEFDDRRPQPGGGIELLRIRLDEERYADAGLSELEDEALQVVVPAAGVEAALRRALLAALRHDAGGMRAVAQRDRQHLLGRRHFEVERQRDLLA